MEKRKTIQVKSLSLEIVTVMDYKDIWVLQEVVLILGGGRYFHGVLNFQKPDPVTQNQF